MKNDVRRRVNIGLYVGCVLALCAAAFLGFRVWNDDEPGTGATLAGGEAAVDESGTDLHSAVLEAATAEATAFVNVDHREFEKHLNGVLDGATGTFKTEFGDTAEQLEKIITKGQAVMHGEVLAAGVVAANKDQATVVVAVRAEVANKETDGKPSERNLGFKLDLDYVDGRWLTADLQEVWSRQ